MRKHLEYIESLTHRGGQTPSDYSELDRWIVDLHALHDCGELPGDGLDQARKSFGEVLTPRTMHGHAYCKPHGYAGDFEIIDRHYLTYTAPEPWLATWDRYWHNGGAAKAVRNRKNYFQNLLLSRLSNPGDRSLTILNLASGPGRDILDFLSNHSADVYFDCVEQDAAAIAYASKLCAPFVDRVRFVHSDVLRFRLDCNYDVIWSAGLFDYLSDRAFKILIKRLLAKVVPGGELVIGNFSTDNPNLDWLWLYEWRLNHRSREHLVSLAVEAGVQPERVAIGSEPEGVNLFLHIRRDGS